MSTCPPGNYVVTIQNIELDEVVVLDISDDALELAAGGAQGGAHTVLGWPYNC